MNSSSWSRTCYSATLFLVLSFSHSTDISAAGQIEKRLEALGLELPPTYKPIANYVLSKRAGNLVFLGGHSECEEPYMRGKVGAERTVDEGYRAARLTGLCLLASLKAEIGDLDKIVQVVKVYGMVNSSPDFKDHSKVINGCSDLLVEVLGEKGRHSRAAVGMASLPLDLTVEIEMVVEVSD